MMAGYGELKHAVYFNTVNAHITTHTIRCSHVDKNDGSHSNKQGGWGYFAEKYAAEQFAKAISNHLGLPANPCGHCKGF